MHDIRLKMYIVLQVRIHESWLGRTINSLFKLPSISSKRLIEIGDKVIGVFYAHR